MLLSALLPNFHPREKVSPVRTAKFGFISSLDSRLSAFRYSSVRYSSSLDPSTEFVVENSLVRDWHETCPLSREMIIWLIILDILVL